MRVCSKLSGELLATIEGEIGPGMIGADLQRMLAQILQVNRFRQQLFYTDNRPVDDRLPLGDVPEQIDIIVKPPVYLDQSPTQQAELVCVCNTGTYEELELLLFESGNPNTTDVYGRTLLTIVAERNDVYVANLLLEAGAG